MFLNPQELLDRVQIRSGSRVGDFGTGSGELALAVAKKMGPEVTIYAFDPMYANLDRLRREASLVRSVFYTIQADLNAHIPIRDSLLSMAIVVNTLFAIRERERFVRELARVMKPDGIVLFADWIGSFNNLGPVEADIVTPSDAQQLFRSNGFAIRSPIPAGTHHYAFTAERTLMSA